MSKLSVLVAKAMLICGIFQFYCCSEPEIQWASSGFQFPAALRTKCMSSWLVRPEGGPTRPVVYLKLTRGDHWFIHSFNSSNSFKLDFMMCGYQCGNAKILWKIVNFWMQLLRQLKCRTFEPLNRYACQRRLLHEQLVVDTISVFEKMLNTFFEDYGATVPGESVIMKRCRQVLLTAQRSRGHDVIGSCLWLSY